MKKLIKRSFVLFIVMMMGLLATNIFAAVTVGQQLTAAEDGWRRIDDKDSYIVNNGFSTSTYPGNYNGSYKLSITEGTTVSFKFYGSKLRIISPLRPSSTAPVQISIDGITKSISEYSSSIIYQVIVYEDLDMNLGIHEVILYGNSVGASIDAIDIDDTGYLLPYDYTNLTAVPSTTTVAITLNWDVVDNATSYTIKRSETQGGSYNTIATDVTEITYTDQTGLEDTTYYYVVVPIINGTEGTQSNEASAMVHIDVPIAGNAVLTITYTDGLQRTYDLPMNTVVDFIRWYEDAMGGSGLPYYKFEKTPTSGNFTKRTEYVIFDKISNFDIDEY